MPSTSVALSVEGVLFKDALSVPIPLGIALYHSLKQNFNILLYSEKTRKDLDYLLGIEALHIQAAIEYNESPRHWLEPSDRKLEQLNSLRQRGYMIEAVVEPDPEAAANMVLHGFNVLHFVHAQSASPQ